MCVYGTRFEGPVIEIYVWVVGSGCVDFKSKSRVACLVVSVSDAVC